MLVPSKRGYVSEINELSRKYGDIILKEMVASANMNNRGIVEREDKLLNTEEYRIKIVKGLTEGVKKAIN